MPMLYTSIEINKVLEDTKETINYYITKDMSYGFKVTKASENAKENEAMSVDNIADSENGVAQLIDELIGYGDNIDQIKYIIEDYQEAVSQKVIA